MKLVLYPENETAFDTNGIGILSDAISCRVTAALNGQYELTMQYPTNGIHYAEIANRSLILAKPDPVSEPQPFRVYRRVPTSAGTVTVYARHIVYDLMGIVVAPFSAANIQAALLGLKANAVTACPFEFWTDKATATRMVVPVPSSIWALLGGSEGSILDVYGGEYEFDRFQVKLYNRRGADRGVSIRYGKNLTSLEQDENCAGCYTGVYPYWTSEDGTVVQLKDKIIDAPGTYSYTSILPLDLSEEWQEAPSEDQLRARAEKYISDRDIGKPTVSWKVQFAQLEQTEEYRGKALLERVLLGDTVAVEFPAMGVSATSRVAAVDYNVLLERYESVTLGRVRSNIADTIVNQQQEIQKKPSRTQMESAISYLSSAIMGASGGAVRLLDDNGDGMPDTLYIADNPDPALATKVWRYNYQGWGASKNGYNGPFVLGASFDSGIIADFITAGTLNANLVKVINLIADHLISVSETSRLEIDGATLSMKSDAYETIRMTNQYAGLPILYMSDYKNGEKVANGEYSPHHIKLGRTSVDPVFKIDITDEEATIGGKDIRFTIPAHGIGASIVDNFTATLSGNGSKTFACSGTPDVVIVAVQRGTGTGTVVTGVWTAAMSGITQTLYGQLDSTLDAWNTTVTISGKNVTVNRGGTTSLKHYITALSH